MGNSFVSGKICMVTGGGGSIGSELVRQLSCLGAKKTVIVDIYENGAYDVMNETDNTCVEIASVRDYNKMDFIMSQYRPDIVFHAAAHKHVPFMENNPEEAVKNNIAGTNIMINLAEKHGVSKFALISTDKAVEPISIMGASKRVCEMLVYEKSKTANTVFYTVRFGNVIGSNGSVIPLFKKQIERGNVTVTDKNVTRYFMTIDEAAYLVLQSLEIAQGGEVFVLDMGESVKILELAKDMIRKSGKNIPITFTGLRKGDKLEEKLFYDFENLRKTKFDKILCAEGSSIDGLYRETDKLFKLAAVNNRDGICNLIMKITDKNLIRRI